MTGRFDMIISNPPFHDGMETSLEAAQTLIRTAVRHLNSGGELRIVANAFLPYPKVLDEVFGFHEVLAQTGRFKIYRAIMTRQAKK
ncbi:Ribosomal RNA small subunit methyltransferase C [compost metagenome]